MNMAKKLAQDLLIKGGIQLLLGPQVTTISSDSGFTSVDNVSIATTQAIKGYVDTKIPKITGATGNLPVFTADGEIIDSGIEANSQFFDYIDFIELSSINSDTQTVIPAKYQITNIVFEEINSNDVGNISIGTVTGGTNIVNSEPVNANELKVAPIGDNIFSKTTNQVIYITSNNWGSGVLSVSIRIEKFTE